MNAVEIEEAVSALAERPFDAAEFPFGFLEAFGNKAITLKRLRTGASNRSDLGGVLQTNNIHIAVAAPGAVGETLARLKASPATAKAKAKYVLTTDGDTFEAEDLETGETVACDYPAFPDHFGFFLPLAGITTVRQVRESSFDIRATSRLNRLYVELLKDNPDWATAQRRPDMNHFMARLIFCFFAERTGIFLGSGMFTATITQMSDRESINTHEVISEVFQALNVPTKHHGMLDNRYRQAAGLRNWANAFPYVNGGLFSGSQDVPRFSRIARSYLLHLGALDWTKINPDIFGSMIQAVADDEERGALGMHYTSVPNILKVLNPLFLDDLRKKLEEAGDNSRKLLNLRNRMSRIRVFDPACGSGNFLVIAYKQMREIEAEINRRRGEQGRASDIPLTNFRGIELRHFPAEIARLALIIAEYQADVLYRGQKLALAEFLPLDQENWITCGNALRLDWLGVCPPTGTGVKLVGDDLFQTPLQQSEIDFENEGGETYICGNPPYAGLSSQTDSQKDDLRTLFEARTAYWKSYDYVMGWFWKAHHYLKSTRGRVAFVSTNSVCQGQLVPMFWPLLLTDNSRILFAYSSFKWRNLASHNAGVMVVIIGLTQSDRSSATLFESSENERIAQKQVVSINAYIVPGPDVYIEPTSAPPSDRTTMFWGNKPVDGGGLILSQEEARSLVRYRPRAAHFLRPFYGSEEFIKSAPRFCVWVTDQEITDARAVPELADRFAAVVKFRASSKAKETRPAAAYPHRFRQIQGAPGSRSIIIPIHTSENRSYLPVGLLAEGSIISNAAYGLYDAPLWNLALIASRLHLVWIATVCGKLKTDFRYSNTLGWNTFPIPPLTEKNKADLTRCAEDILLAREAHFPATIAELYDPERMDRDFPSLSAAHDRNDEVLERIYVGRRFRNDTERLENLFGLYTKRSANTR
jgi:hypothetical protein